jgi:transglutaminase-like putative cysteine protease
MKAQLFEVTHTSTYDYQSAVTVAHHLLRLGPRRLPRQARLAHELVLDPPAANLGCHTDYFGNEVAFAIVESAHRRLRITARSRVAVGAAFIPEASETPSWESVRSLCRRDLSATVLEASEFVYASPLVPVDTAFGDYARPSFPAGRPILDAVNDLTARLRWLRCSSSGGASARTSRIWRLPACGRWVCRRGM